MFCVEIRRGDQAGRNQSHREEAEVSEAGVGPLRGEVMDDDVRRKEDNPVRNDNGVATVAAMTDWRRSSAEEINVCKIGVSCTKTSK